MADALDRLKIALQGRFAIKRELGAGGMATVYLAEDLKHHRQVAVKVLRPDLAAALGTERFNREIEIAAKLNHSHILPLLDSGTAEEQPTTRPPDRPSVFLFYVMPHVDGESLRQRLNRETQLPIEDALQLTEQVASALDYAHRHDVIHRDIKPENIMLHEGVAMVTDFGIALAVKAAGGERLTETGLSLGTPAYMSPEQVAGDRDVDARSDIYSLACVLYEMLAGDPPFTGATPQVILARHVTDPAPPITTARSSVPSPVAAAIEKALGKARADRFESARAFSEALRAEFNEADPDTKSIAVLPFANLSPDPDNEYFSDGMTEEIINALVHLEDVHVASRSSSFAFKGGSPDIAEVGAKLKVATVLEGSVRRSGDRLRITAQLIKVADGYHIWSERYDRRMEDVFDIQDEIAHAIVGALKVKLLGADSNQLLKRGTNDLEAYHLYLKGRLFWLQRGERFKECIPYFAQAIEKDPHYAPPHAGLADAFCTLAWYGFVPPRDAYAKARSAAERAVALDDRLAEAHYSLGFCEFIFGWDLDVAELEFRRAIELDPRMTLAHLWLALVHAALGRVPESAAEAKRAQELEPISPITNALAALAYYWAGRPTQAREAAQRALEINPMLALAHWMLGHVAAMESNWEDAVNALEQAVSYMKRSPMMLMSLGSTYARSGREADARRILEELQEMSELRAVSSLFAAQIALDLGQLDHAFELLERATEERAPTFYYVATMPGYTWPRSDPRLVSLLERPELKWLERVTPRGR